MAYEFATAKRSLKDAVEGAMENLDMARRQADARDNDRAEAYAEIANGYARLAQAMAEAMEETA